MGQDQTPSNLLDLPRELLDHIMSFLPLCSIPRLMVNKKLRPVCEQYLYRSIQLADHPYRSLRLLLTLAHRPDLALFIRDLRINLSPCHPGLIYKPKLPGILQPDGLAPLYSARNIRYLHIGGMDWLWDPSLANIRRLVSQMELTSLLIAESYNYLGYDINDEEINRRIFNLRTILQSQPQLEFLCLAHYGIKPVHLNAIEVADVPNLRRFNGNASYAGPFLKTAPKLSKLYLDFDSRMLETLGKGWSGHKVQDLAISVSHSDWDDFESVLARFPNAESLSIWSEVVVLPESLPPRLRALPLLRKLEIQNIWTAGTEHFDQAFELVTKCKEHCPTLERFIDTKNRQWVYVSCADEGSGFRAELDCQLEANSLSFRFDLLPPEWDV